ncbi:MAG: lysine--tRNA ligase [bacterium]
MALEDIRKIRLEKLEKIRSKGIDPYPAESHKTHYISEVISDFEDLEKKETQITIAGRVMSLRGQGAIIFSDIFDGTSKFQALLKKDEMSGDYFDFWNEVIDIGDFVEITGNVFITKRGEKTLKVSSWNILSKSLLPLPEKWQGLQDPEEKLRKRYLDILFDHELRGLLEKKAKFWDTTREFLKSKGFMEVETPTLELTTGGAEARPFETHHNDYDIDVYLRISVGELWQKRLMAAGFPKTFEIGRIYRNEGSSPEHLQEFTNMEFYLAYASFKEGMVLVKEMYRDIANKVFGTTEFTTRGHTFNLADEWKEVDYREEIIRQTKIDIDKATDKEIKEKLNELKVKYEGENRERLTDSLWKYCRRNISGPAFLINHPKLIAPLAKSNLDRVDTVQRFQIILAGSEVGNGYSELNDPVEQRKRFEEQQKMIDRGDEEAMMADFEFVEMLEYGMPPTCGFGFGERLFSFLADKPIREVAMFPLIRPKEEPEQK